MGEHLIKPYEISVWEDKLTQDGLKEIKLAVIGSDTMTGPNKVYEPVFTKKVNGEKTLSFSLKYKYFDPYSGNEDVVNPFAALLVNERKVKLKYDGQWYEFIVKDHTESSEEYTWTYTCTDAFVLELSKNGYNIEFNTELNNNQGTALELAQTTLENTDWQVSADNFKQLIAEPIYKATLESVSGIEIIDANDGSAASGLQANTLIYLFYSYVKNKNGKFVQFILRDGNYIIDDKNVITATNYRIKTELTFKDNGFYLDDTLIISISEIETLYQANRLAYAQKTTYDPIMQRTVDCFKANDREIYRYVNDIYTTSNIVMNYMANGDNFNSLEEGTLQGWNPYVDSEHNEDIGPLELVTYPELEDGKPLADLETLSQIEGYLKVNFIGAVTNNYLNTIFNDGIQGNTQFINSISQGDEFVFRWCAGKGELGSLQPVETLGLLVARYTRDTPQRWGRYYYHIDTDDIILDIKGAPNELNNIIEGGEIQEIEGSQIYVINDVAQTISTKYLYRDGDSYYYWNGLTSEFELYGTLVNGEIQVDPESTYLPYYYLIGKAEKAVPNSVLTDPTVKYGIFIYTTAVDTETLIDEETEEPYTEVQPIYIQDIQFTRCLRDANEQPVIIGNVPAATITPTEYYYLKPSDGTAAEDIQTYTSVEDMANMLGVQVADIKPIYNESSEKNLSISISQSNCFNILQTIAETFECWIDLVVDHDPDTGYITYDEETGRPNKYVYLRKYAGKDNWAGFKYGINLNSIERNINSDEIVTKLIVDQSQSDYVDEGYISIANSPSNPSGESYILNFDYYYNQGLLNREEVEAVRVEFIDNVKELNVQLQEKELKRRNLEASLLDLGSKRNVYTELIDSAQDEQTKALEDFKYLTEREYEDYKDEYNQNIENSDDSDDLDDLIEPIDDSIEDDEEGEDEETSEDTEESLLKEENVLAVLGRLYASSAVINNYSGILSNIETEYWNVRKQLRGSENYEVKIWTGYDEHNERHIFVEVDDYLIGFSFTINSNTYTVDLSQKYFDITVSSDTEITITFSAPENYTIETDSYVVQDRTVRFKIISENNEQGVEDKIDELLEQKKELINTFNNKYSRFIQEGTWNSTDYIDSELYYLDALQVSNTSAQPSISYTINVVEVSQLEDLEDYLFDAGDKTYVEDTEFFGWADRGGIHTPAREEVIVSEVEWHLEEPENNVITVQNYKTRFEDLFQRISATVQTVQYNEATYAKMSSLMDANGTINADVLVQSLQQIAGKQYNLTSDGSIIIDGDEILVRNLNNTQNYVIINSKGIQVTSNAGTTKVTAIDGFGINAGSVYTGELNTQNVIIGNSQNPSFRWDKSGISAYKSIDDEAYDLRTFVRYDQYGLYGIKNSGTFKANSLQEVKDNAHFAVTWDGFFIKNSYEGGGRVEITSDNDFRVLNDPQNQGNFQEKIKIGALEWGDGITSPDAEGATALPTLYGIRIKNDAGAEVMKTDDDGNITISGTINANAGNIGGMSVNQNTLRMNHTVFERGFGIYSDILTSDDEPVFIISDVDGTAVFNAVTARGHIEAATGTLGDLDVIDTITVGSTGAIESSNYSIANQTGWHIDDNSATFNNANVRGVITALQGDFLGMIRVGPTEQNQEHIIIDGTRALLKSSNFQEGAGYGWMINKDGDAVFNNITARGAIKTAVFEYAEIQAVGGIFIFRPSSTIKKARLDNNNLVLKVEKPTLFAKLQNQEYSWCKISNYTTDGTEPNVQDILLTNGLTHVYKISNVNLNTAEVTLEDGAQFVSAVIQLDQSIEDVLVGLEGGALVDMGREDGSSNYGIGVNSSDNTVNLPRRAISLFETVVDRTKNPKVSYKYQGIFGTLPELSVNDVDNSIYNQQMAGTQGIYTDNMYIGDGNQFIAFYEDANGNKQLKIKANQIVYEVVDDDTGQIDWHDVSDIETEGVPGPPGPAGEDAITVKIESSAGEVFLNKQITTTLTCTVIKGNGTDITNQVTRFNWIKKKADGTIDTSWSRPLAGNTISISEADVTSKAIFICEVEF